MEARRQMTDDRALVDAVLANAPGAFARLVREYQGLCWHIIQRMVRNPEDARELCQDTFLSVHQSLHQYRYESALKSWIGRVAYTVALRHLERKRIAHRRQRARRATATSRCWTASATAVDLEADCADQEMHAHLLAAIDTLPPLPRTVLTLYHLDELSIPEIAQVTGLAAGTIKSHLFRTRLKLRETLETQLGALP